MARIKEVQAEVIHDSRGDDTLQVSVKTDRSLVAAAVPMGVSKGKFEAVAVKPNQSVEFISNELAPLLVNRDPEDQSGIDRLLIEQDGTADKSRLGANTLLGISMAVSRAAAASRNLPLYQYLGLLTGRSNFFLPIPMFNLINGGLHADNNLEIQEFMIIPDRLNDYHNQLSAGRLIFSTLGRLLRDDAATLPVGDEGGYAPNLDTNEMACDLLVRAIKDSGYEPWSEVSLGLDVAAACLPATFEATPNRYIGLIKDFPILSLEDPFGEDDWDQWAQLKRQMEETNFSTKRLMLVGDDLFATNLARLKIGLEKKAANAILIKLNQIGTVTETLEVVRAAQQAGYLIIVSHRSGETLDDYIADFAVGVGAQFIKTGAPNDNHQERMSKYLRLLKIENELTSHV